jgi:hypothetical protein
MECVNQVLKNILLYMKQYRSIFLLRLNDYLFMSMYVQLDL